MHLKAPPSHAPFKGEAFPSYVLQRAARGAGCSSPQHVGSVTATLAGADSAATQSSVRFVASTAYTSLPSPSASAIVSCTPALTCRTPQPRTVSSPPGSTTRGSRALQRPSLSDQLRSISQGAQDITAQLKTSYKLHPGSSPCCSGAGVRPASAAVLLQATTIGMTVGKLECRFPCPVFFLHDHCAFLFQHPFAAKEIQMVMFYRDMALAHVSLRDRSFSFRVARALEQFGSDYDPANPQHAIRIVLATASEAQRVKQFVNEHRFGPS